MFTNGNELLVSLPFKAQGCQVEKNYAKERIPKQLLGVENNKVHTKCLHTYKQQTPWKKVPPSHI